MSCNQGTATSARAVAGIAQLDSDIVYHLYIYIVYNLDIIYIYIEMNIYICIYSDKYIFIYIYIYCVFFFRRLLKHYLMVSSSTHFCTHPAQQYSVTRLTHELVSLFGVVARWWSHHT